MDYQPETLKAVQAVELEILREIIRVCEKCDITYFAIGGTNLGALRHDGFIPWDDDIDIGMLRDDYERFLELAPDELADGYVLQWFGTEPATPVYFAKVRKDGTRFVELGKGGLDMHQGIFVDVMPFDKVPSGEKLLQKHSKRSRRWKEMLIAKSICQITVEVPQPTKAFATVFRTALHIALLPVSKSWVFRRYDEHLRQYNASDGKRYSSRGLKSFECDYDDLVPPVPHAFESITIMVPAHSDKVLTTHYGDWRKLPPEESRRNHAPKEISFDDGAQAARR